MDLVHINEGGTADIQSVPTFGTDFLLASLYRPRASTKILFYDGLAAKPRGHAPGLSYRSLRPTTALKESEET